MGGRPLHHVALTPRDFLSSLRFYRDGLGLQLLADLDGLKGGWRHIFAAPSDELRSVFLGSPEHGNAGVVELVIFSDDVDATQRSRGPSGIVDGFFLLSFYVADVEATVSHLKDLGLCDDPKTTTVGEGASAFTVGTVRDPDGILIELVGLPTEQGFG